MDDKANYVGQSLEFFVRNEGEFYTSVSCGFYAFIVLWCMAYGPESVFVISKTKKGHWYVTGPGGKQVAGIEPTSSESQNKTKQNPGQTKKTSTYLVNLLQVHKINWFLSFLRFLCL